MFHDITFDAGGNPLPPLGVDEELWQLELPSILGIAWSGGRPLDGVSDDGPSEYWEDDESASSCCSSASVLSEAEEFLRNHAIGVNVVWGSPAVFPKESWSLPPEGHMYVLDVPPLSDASPPSHPAELLAYRLLHRGSMHSAHFLQLMDVLPDSQKGKRRSCVMEDMQGRKQFTFAAGAYKLGGIHGVMHATLAFPWVTRLLVAVVRGCCHNHIFSAAALHCNQRMSPHVDLHNERGRPNLLIPCTRWSGGGLWVSNNRSARTLTADSEVGRVIHIAQPYTIMNPHILHATMEWAGARMLLVAYAVADPGMWQESDRQRLRDLGFSVQY